MWHVDLPLLAPSLAAAAIFAFAVSLGEFGASLLIARPEYPTMPIAIYRFLGQPGALNYGQALAMSSLLMLVTASSAALIEWIRLR
jgi:thiamine transport system permease protein